MQVIFDEHIFLTQRFGGISRYICELAKALAETGEIRVVVYGGWTKNAYIKELAPTDTLSVLYRERKTELRINTFAQFISAAYGSHLLRRYLKQDADTIYHLTYFTYHPALVSAARATVCTFYDFIPEWETNPGEREQAFLTMRKSIAQASDALLAISESTRKDFCHHLPDYYNKVSTTYLATNFQQQTGLTRKAQVIIVGNRSGYKNGINALKAFAKAAQQSTVLTLVIAGGPELNDEERRILKTCFDQDRITLTSADDASLVKAYSESAVLLYPSRYEGFGLPVLEAMQCGCPVITSNISSLPEVGGDAPLYVDPEDVDAMAQACLTLCTDTVVAEKHRALGFAQCTRFSWKKTAEQTLAVYRKLLERG